MEPIKNRRHNCENMESRGETPNILFSALMFFTIICFKNFFESVTNLISLSYTVKTETKNGGGHTCYSYNLSFRIFFFHLSTPGCISEVFVDSVWAISTFPAANTHVLISFNILSVSQWQKLDPKLLENIKTIINKSTALYLYVYGWGIQKTPVGQKASLPSNKIKKLWQVTSCLGEKLINNSQL